MPLRSRADGTLVEHVHPVRRIMPFVMPGRNEAFVLFEQQIALAPLQSRLARLNAARPPARAATLFHLVLHALGETFSAFPRLNRFVAGGQLYDRRGIWLSFSAKTALERDASIFTAKLEFLPGESLASMIDRCQALVGRERAAPDTATEREVRGFLRLPASVLRVGTRLMRWADGHNLLPARFIAGDPLYASAFVANLGSVGLDAAFHHLYEYGSIPIFVTIGRVRRVAVVHEDGSVGSRDVLPLRYTYDERTEDGFYAARALEHFQALLETP